MRDGKLCVIDDKTQGNARIALAAALRILFDGAESVDCVVCGWQVTASRSWGDGYRIHLRCLG